MTEDVTAYLVPDGDSYAPTRIAQGPWGHTMAGHVVGGILGWAIERTAGDPKMQPARLTVDLFVPPRLSRCRSRPPSRGTDGASGLPKPC